jgi:hypothetical protein
VGRFQLGHEGKKVFGRSIINDDDLGIPRIDASQSPSQEWGAIEDRNHHREARAGIHKKALRASSEPTARPAATATA